MSHSKSKRTIMKKIVMLSVVAAGMLFIGCGEKTKEAVSDETSKAVLETKEVTMGAVDKTVEVAAKASTATVDAIDKAADAIKKEASAIADKVEKTADATANTPKEATH